MDTKIYPKPVMEKTLSFLEMTNKFFGGNAVILDYFESLSLKEGNLKEPLHILDVGTGSADIPRTLSQWARKKKIPIHVTAIDLVPEIIEIAKEKTKAYPEISILQKDFFEFLEIGKKFDYVISSLLLHHIPHSKTVSTLKAFDEIATKGVLISDLLRTPWSYRSIKLLSILSGNEVVRNDAPLSVRRGFLPKDLEKLAKDAGLSYLKVKKEPWFRIRLSGVK